MRFHLIDRIEAHEPGRRIRAVKLTSRTEWFWRGPEGAEEMPEPLILEALGQAGAWLVLLTTQRCKRVALLSVESARFCGPVVPGDVLVMEAGIESMSDDAVVISGRVTVDGRPVLDARNVLCALLDAGTLEDDDATGRMQAQLTEAR